MKDKVFKQAKERSIRYLAQTITDADYADDIALLANIPAQAETLLHRLERVAAGIGLHVNAVKTEYMCGHLPPITKNIKVRRNKYAGHCWRSGDELISNILLWTPSHGRTKGGRPARIYIQLLCANTGCSLEDLPETMNNKYRWWKRDPCWRCDMMMVILCYVIIIGNMLRLFSSNN